MAWSDAYQYDSATNPYAASQDEWQQYASRMQGGMPTGGAASGQTANVNALNPMQGGMAAGLSAGAGYAPPPIASSSGRPVGSAAGAGNVYAQVPQNAGAAAASGNPLAGNFLTSDPSKYYGGWGFGSGILNDPS